MLIFCFKLVFYIKKIDLILKNWRIKYYNWLNNPNQKEMKHFILEQATHTMVIQN